jgi:hypothetical protein
MVVRPSDRRRPRLCGGRDGDRPEVIVMQEESDAARV